MTEQKKQPIRRVIKVVRRKVPDTVSATDTVNNISDESVSSRVTPPSTIAEEHPMDVRIAQPTIVSPSMDNYVQDINDQPYDPAEDPNLATVPDLDAQNLGLISSNTAKEQHSLDNGDPLNQKLHSEEIASDVNFVSEPFQRSNPQPILGQISKQTDTVDVDKSVLPDDQNITTISNVESEHSRAMEAQVSARQEQSTVAFDPVIQSVPKVMDTQEVKGKENSVSIQNQTIAVDKPSSLVSNTLPDHDEKLDTSDKEEPKGAVLPASSNQVETVVEQPTQSSQKVKFAFVPPPVVEGDVILSTSSPETSPLPHKFTQVPRDQDFKSSTESVPINAQDSEDTKDSSFPNYEEDSFVDNLNLSKKVLSTKFMVMITTGIFLFGLLVGIFIFGGSSEPAHKSAIFSISGIVQNPEVPGGRARCGTTEMSQGCVLYIQNNKTRELQAKDFYPLVMQLTGMQRFQIETGNMRYAYKVIKPGWIAQFNIPPATK